MRDHAPHVASWVKRMISPDASENNGEYLPNDQIPDTLLPVITRMFDEQVPVLLQTARQLEQWTHANPDSIEVPRAIGTLRYRLGGMEEERLVLPYNLWMWQRAHDFYNGLDADDRKAVDSLLNNEQVQALRTPLTARVQRRGNRLERQQ